MMVRIRIEIRTEEDDDDAEEDQDDHYRDDTDDDDLAVDVPLQHWMALTEDH